MPESNWPSWLDWVPEAYRKWLLRLIAALILIALGAVLRHFGWKGELPPPPTEVPAEVVPADNPPTL